MQQCLVESIHHFRLRETVCGLSSKLSERPFRISALQAVLTMTRLGRQSLLTSAFLFYACLFLEGVVCKGKTFIERMNRKGWNFVEILEPGKTLSLRGHRCGYLASFR
jgi:hypothetical protein